MNSVVSARILYDKHKLIKILENFEKMTTLSISRKMGLENTLVENHWTLKSYFDKIEATDQVPKGLL